MLALASVTPDSACASAVISPVGASYFTVARAARKSPHGTCDVDDAVASEMSPYPAKSLGYGTAALSPLIVIVTLPLVPAASMSDGGVTLAFRLAGVAAPAVM